MKTLVKCGRFAYLLPYVVLPFFCMFFFNVDFGSAWILSYAIPFAVESPILLLFPVCWIISVICFVRTFRENKGTQDSKAQKRNVFYLLLTVLWTLIHIVLMFLFITNFRMNF